MSISGPAGSTARRTWAQHVLNLDRRIIYGVVFLLVLLPLLRPIGLPINITPEVRKAYDLIEGLPQGAVVLVSCDFGPSTAPECLPVYQSLLHQCFRKGLVPIIVTLTPDGRGMAVRGLNFVLAAKDGSGQPMYASLVSGKDYAFLGYKAGSTAVIIGTGQSFATTFPRDGDGKPIGEMPIFNQVKKLGDCDAIFDIAAVGLPEYWLSHGAERYHVPLAVSCTAVSAAQYYPYFLSGQFKGLVNGMKGAAEYEKLVDKQYSAEAGAALLGDATKGMDAQSAVHIFIVLAIIMANIALFSDRAASRSGRRA